MTFTPVVSPEWAGELADLLADGVRRRQLAPDGLVSLGVLRYLEELAALAAVNPRTPLTATCPGSLTVAEMAAIVAVSERTVRRMLGRGKWPGAVKRNGRWEIPR
jgi:hypothetical protein